MTARTIKIVIAAVLAVCLIAFGVGAASWWYGRQLRDLRLEAINALADADTLRLVATARGDSLKIFEQRAHAVERERDLLESVAEELQARLKETGRTLATVTDAYIEVRDELTIATRAQADGDSTRIAYSHADSTVEIDVALAFAGRVAPDPEPEVVGQANIAVRVAGLFTLSCDDDGAPHAEATLTDPRVTLTRLEARAADEVCLPPAPALPGFFPRLNAPTGIAFGAGVALGYALTR